MEASYLVVERGSFEKYGMKILSDQIFDPARVNGEKYQVTFSEEFSGDN